MNYFLSKPIKDTNKAVAKGVIWKLCLLLKRPTLPLLIRSCFTIIIICIEQIGGNLYNFI